MDGKKSNFLKFCESDIAKLKNESDPEEKLHWMRRINYQMYAEACKQNYDDYTICKTLSDDLDEYMKLSVPVYKAKFDQMLLKLNIKTPVTAQPKIDAKNVRNSSKCGDVCKNDELLDDLDKFFNSMKNSPKLIPSKPPNPASVNRPTKISVDESNGDLVFETNFRSRTVTNKNVDSWQPTPIVNRPNFVPENRQTLPRCSTDCFNKFGANKRRLEESHSFANKRPACPLEPENRDTNMFERRNDFKTAAEELVIQHNRKHGGTHQNEHISYNLNPSGGLRKSLGGRRTIVNNPTSLLSSNHENRSSNSNQSGENDSDAQQANLEKIAASHNINPTHPRLKNVDPKMIENVINEIVEQCDRIEWSSIAGLGYAKKVIMEAVILPILRPDIFTGMRQPPRGVLLFGPPGTGKTLIGKCIASQSQSTFFSISSSSLTSKWIGEGEKMVRALFAVAAAAQPSVVFIDEVDSLLSQRSEHEHESSRRMKTEFLVRLDGTGTTEKDRVLIVGATNRPQELDEAARRRFVKKLYIPLPDFAARCEIMVNLIKTINHNVTQSELEQIARRTDGFSGADMKVLCQEAVMGPVRSISYTDMTSIAAESVRPVMYDDFKEALNCVKASVSPKDLQQYIDWNAKYGSGKI